MFIAPRISKLENWTLFIDSPSQDAPFFISLYFGTLRMCKCDKDYSPFTDEAAFM